MADVDPISTAVTALRGIDALYGEVLCALAEASPEGGVPAERLIGYAALLPGWDVTFLTGCVDTLAHMPRLRAAFADGQVSWAQLRPIVSRARRLPPAAKARLDELLSGPIAANRHSEPEALVDDAASIVTRLEDLAAAERELAEQRRSFLRMQPDLLGGVDLWGHLDDTAAATLSEALDAAADLPVADDTQAVDDDGNPVPSAWQAPTVRGSQLAEALERLASSYLAGDTGRRGRPTFTVVVDVADLTPGTGRHPATRRGGAPADDGLDDGGVPLAASRLLWALAGGRRPISSAAVRQVGCDATWVPLLTDGTAVLATGDSHDPISTALRRAVLARDQGCRFASCRTPARHCDLHHLVARVDGGPTTAENLIALCRFHHRLVERAGWHLDLDDDATLTIRRGRWTLVTRARLRPAADPDPPRDGDLVGAGAGPPGR